MENDLESVLEEEIFSSDMIPVIKAGKKPENAIERLRGLFKCIDALSKDFEHDWFISLFEELSPNGRLIAWRAIMRDTESIKEFHHYDKFKNIDLYEDLKKYIQLKEKGVEK